MPTLHELQSRFAAAVVDSDASELAGSIIDDAPGAAARLGIYVDHFRVTLIDALVATFPIVQQLVGEAFFQAVARRYVRATPPAHPCLFAYGGDFPDFLERLPEVRSLAYLPHVARLEWAINEAWHAPDAPAIDVDAAAGVIAGGFRSRSSAASVVPTGRVAVSGGSHLAGSPVGVQRARVHRPGRRRGPAPGASPGRRGRLDRHPPAGLALLESLIMDGSPHAALTFARAVDRVSIRPP